MLRQRAQAKRRGVAEVIDCIVAGNPVAFSPQDDVSSAIFPERRGPCSGGPGAIDVSELPRPDTLVTTGTGSTRPGAAQRDPPRLFLWLMAACSGEGAWGGVWGMNEGERSVVLPVSYCVVWRRVLMTGKLNIFTLECFFKI